MKKKFIKMIAGMILIAGCCTNIAYAKSYTANVPVEDGCDEKSLFLPKIESSSRDIQYANPRASIISTAIADISNAGGGKIDILIETLAHVPCDEIHHKAYLEQWDEAEQDWCTVDSFNFVEYKEDHPDEDLTALTSTVTVTNQPSGYYYRVRGFHTVWLNGVSQGFITHTNGVLITAKP